MIMMVKKCSNNNDNNINNVMNNDINNNINNNHNGNINDNYKNAQNHINSDDNEDNDDIYFSNVDRSRIFALSSNLHFSAFTTCTAPNYATQSAFLQHVTFNQYIGLIIMSAFSLVQTSRQAVSFFKGNMQRKCTWVKLLMDYYSKKLNIVEVHALLQRESVCCVDSEVIL